MGFKEFRNVYYFYVLNDGNPKPVWFIRVFVTSE